MDIKIHKGWKYDDKTCIGCNVREDTGNEILLCFYFGEEISTKPMHYDMFYDDSVSVMILVATLIMKKLKNMQNIIDNG